MSLAHDRLASASSAPASWAPTTSARCTGSCAGAAVDDGRRRRSRAARRRSPRRVPGVRATADPAALIADDAVEAIVIASHDSTHADLAIAAVQAGKPVMCEKPLAPTVAECVRVMEAERAATAGGAAPLVSVGFMRRFDPGYVELKAALDAAGVRRPARDALRQPRRALRAGRHERGQHHAVRRSTSSTCMPWLLGSPITEVSWHAPALGRPRARARGPAGDAAAHGRRRADHARGLPQRALRLRHPLRGRRRARDARARPTRRGSSPTSRAARFAAHPPDWRPRFADAYRLQLQAWIDAVAAGAPPPLATAADGPDRHRRRRGRHRLHARRRPPGRGRGAAPPVRRPPAPSHGSSAHGACPPRPGALATRRPQPRTETPPAAHDRLPRHPSPPRTPPSDAAPALRWGVLGTGWIAERFIRSLQRHTRQQVLAVGSRDARALARLRRRERRAARLRLLRGARRRRRRRRRLRRHAAPRAPSAARCSRSRPASTCWWRSRSR